MKQAHADEKRKKREKSRARDRGLKERTELRKRERVENDVVSRMERTMRDGTLEKRTMKQMKMGWK